MSCDMTVPEGGRQGKKENVWDHRRHGSGESDSRSLTKKGE